MQHRPSPLFSGLVVMVATLASCALEPASYTIDGVGVGSSCEFSGEFADEFPCEMWQGSSPSPESLTLASFHFVSTDAVYLGVASSKPLSRIESDVVERYEIDGTLAVFALEPMNGDSADFRFVAEDGSAADCVYTPRESGGFRCDGWS